MSIYEPEPGAPFDPATIVRGCIESGSSGLLLDEANISPVFFDLSTRVAGDLVHRLTLYDIPLAVVVPDLSAHSSHFQDFAREANRGKLFRFVATRDEAVEWLDQTQNQAAS